MSEWHLIDTSHFMKPQTSTEGGVRVEFSLSPYDIPEAVRGYFDERSRKSIIEFRYIQEEPCDRVSINEQVAVLLGKRSFRLYGIEIDATPFDPSEALSQNDIVHVLRAAKAAIKELTDRTKGGRAASVPPDNARTLKDVFNDSYKNIQKGLRESAPLQHAM